jgi:uncharacterized protein
MLRDQIETEMRAAIKGSDKVELETLRYLLSEIKNAEIDAKELLPDEAVIGLFRRELKRRQEAIEAFESGGRAELVAQELAKMAIVERYVPQMLDEAAVGTVVDEVMASGQTDFGVVMGQVMNRLKGKADGKTVTAIVRERLATLTGN